MGSNTESDRVVQLRLGRELLPEERSPEGLSIGNSAVPLDHEIRTASVHRLSLATDAVAARDFGRKSRIFSALALGVLLFLLNSVGQIAVFLSPRPGGTLLLVPKTGDNFQYLSWFETHKSSVLIENYFTAESTPRAYISPLALTIAILSRKTGVDAAILFQVVRFILYLISALATLYCLEAFLTETWQLVGAVLVAFCSIPIRSLAVPIMALRGSAFPFGVPGAEEYMYVANSVFQDWNHSIFGILGAAVVVAGVAGCHRFAERGSRFGLAVYTLTCGASALFHPFEVFLLLPYALVVLWYRRGFVAAIKSILLPLAVSAVCILPFAIPTFSVKWVRLAADQNRGVILMPPPVLLASLGLPSILAVLTLAYVLLKRAKSSGPLVDVSLWMLFSLLLPYCGFLPFPRHLLNGVSIAVGILCVMMFQAVRALELSRNLRLLLFVSIAMVSLGSVASHLGIRYFALRDAISPELSSGVNRTFPAAFLSREEGTVLRWFRNHTSPSDSALGQPPYSWLLPSIPIHSFGGHNVWGYKKSDSEGWRQRNAIFSGTSDPERTDSFLRRHRIRFIVAPASTILPSYCMAQLHVEQQIIYECLKAPHPELPPSDLYKPMAAQSSATRK